MGDLIKIKGKIIHIGEVKSYKEGKFKKLDIVIETKEKYPQKIMLEIHKTEILDNFKVSDDVEVFINLRGREWKGKYYNSIVVWKVSADTTGATQSMSGASPFNN